MSELKPCPFCGRAQLTDTDRGETNPYTGGTQSRACDWCSVSTTDWNNRPIEDALNAEIARLRDAARWIPVSERLPEDNQNIVAFNFSKTSVDLWKFSPFLKSYFVRHYSHWMPIPQFITEAAE